MLLTAVGAALAVAQPGDLGRREGAAAPTVATTTTTAVTADPASTPSSVVTTPEPTTTIEGSGLSTATAPTGGSDGVAQTGRASMLGIGLALGALGIVVRRAARPIA